MEASMLETLLAQVFDLLLEPVLLALAGWAVVAIRKAGAAAQEASKITWVDTLIGQAQAAGENAVNELFQTAIAQLKASKEDGKLTPEEARAAFRAAVNAAWAALSQPVRDGLSGLFGGEAGAKSALGKMVESAVARGKVAGMDGGIVAKPTDDAGRRSLELVLARQRLGLE